MTRHKGLTHNEVAHRWANDPAGLDHGEGHNMFFHDGVIYSYGLHFPIARHVTGANGACGLLLTTENYSVSTAKHKGITWRACHHIKPQFHVPLIDSRTSMSRDDLDAGFHDFNLRSYQERYDAAVERLERLNCNSCQDSYQWDMPAAIEREAREYCAFFGHDGAVVPTFRFYLDYLRHRLERLQSPEAEAAREIEREKRLERERRHWIKHLDQWARGEVKYLDRKAPEPSEENAARRREVMRARYGAAIAAYATGDNMPLSALHDYALTQELREYMTDAQQAQRNAFEREENKEKIAAWIAGDQNHLNYNLQRLVTDEEKARRAENIAKRDKENRVRWQAGDTTARVAYGGPILLRIRGHEIETSHGARFPLTDGTRAFRFIQAVRERGKCWAPNGDKGPQLGHYRIDRIAGDGTVRAGCHTVPWASIEYVAKQLGLI